MSQERMRCFVEHDATAWKAYCVEIDLFATGNTADEARASLDRMLERYCYEADEGMPGAHAIRKPNLSRRLKYWAARLFGHESGAYTRHCYEFRAPPQLLTGLA